MDSLPPVFVATVGEREVYVGEHDNWMVKHGSHWCDTPGLRAHKSLLWLPVLEHEYPVVHAALLAGLVLAGLQPAEPRMATFPVQDLLALAFTSGASLYWVDLALTWASQVGVSPDLVPLVRALALNPAMEQAIRHRAKRLYYTGKV